jgi:hypothetical protein
MLFKSSSNIGHFTWRPKCDLLLPASMKRREREWNVIRLLVWPRMYKNYAKALQYYAVPYFLSCLLWKRRDSERRSSKHFPIPVCSHSVHVFLFVTVLEYFKRHLIYCLDLDNNLACILVIIHQQTALYICLSTSTFPSPSYWYTIRVFLNYTLYLSPSS